MNKMYFNYMMFFLCNFQKLGSAIFIVPDFAHDPQDAKCRVYKRNVRNVFSEDGPFQSCSFFNWNDRDYLNRVFTRLVGVVSGEGEVEIATAPPNSPSLGLEIEVESNKKFQLMEERFFRDTENDIAKPGLKLSNTIQLFKRLISLGNLQERRVLSAALLAFDIIDFQNNSAYRHEPISLIGVGVHGGQIAHLASNFLKAPQRDTVVGFVITLALILLGNDPIALMVRGLLLAGKTIAVAVRAEVLRRCAELLKHDPALLESAKCLIDYAYQKNSSPQVKIANMCTIGSTFIKGSILPNFEIVENYFNFYSASDVIGSFAHNELIPKIITQRLGVEEDVSLRARVLNCEVQFVAEEVPCCFRVSPYFSPSHDDLINSPYLLASVKSILNDQGLLPHQFQKSFAKLLVSSVPQKPRITAFNPHGVWNMIKRIGRNIFCCGWCYRDTLIFDE